MGLFFNSQSKEKKEQILRDVSIINAALRNAVSLLDNQGVTSSTVKSFTSTLGSVEVNISRVSSTVQSMSDSQLMGFSVPWIDGRYIGIMMWLLSMSTVVEQIGAEIEKQLK